MYRKQALSVLERGVLMEISFFLLLFSIIIILLVWYSYSREKNKVGIVLSVFVQLLAMMSAYFCKTGVTLQANCLPVFMISFFAFVIGFVFLLWGGWKIYTKKPIKIP